MRRGSSTIVCLTGGATEDVLAPLGRASNLVVVRGEDEELDASLRALDEAGRRSAPFVVVAADPMASVAEAWRRLWNVGVPSDPAEFEREALRVTEAGRRGRLELPDYFVVVVDPPQPPAGPEPEVAAPHRHDLYLGVLRSRAPARVVPVVRADARETAERVLHALATLPQGPWWPPLDELFEEARTFFPQRIAG